MPLPSILGEPVLRFLDGFEDRELPAREHHYCMEDDLHQPAQEHADEIDKGNIYSLSSKLDFQVLWINRCATHTLVFVGLFDSDSQ